MSNISSSVAWPVTLMRWVARLLSIPWAFWALFWTWFILAHSFQGAVLVIVMVIPSLMFVGAAIIAGVWGKEAFGGGVLLVDGVLIFVCGAWVNVLAISTLVLPPLLAGSLFLACHRISKTSREPRV